MAGYDIHANSEIDFEVTVNFLIKKFNIKSIVETGTYNGAGSTFVFARTGLKVTTIECVPENNIQAKFNLKDYLNVDVLLGYSLYLKDMVEFIKNDDIYDKKDLAIASEGDSPEKNKWNYTNELGNRNIPENLLKTFGDIEENQIIFLDSAGGVGYAEFKEFLNFKNIKNKILLLDDVMHVKHYRSMLDIEKMGKKFNFNTTKRFGWTNFME